MDAQPSRFIVCNITWNKYNWREIYVNSKAGHRYAQSEPGHESLNFRFDKEGIDDQNYVYGFVKWSNQPVKFIAPGFIFFFTRNLNEKNPDKRNQIVGIYGNATIVDKTVDWKGFEDDKLSFNIRAEQTKSILFQFPLDANRYSGGKRLVPQCGFTYKPQDLATRIITDEIEILESNGEKKGIDKLCSIFESITGKRYDVQRDQEQLELVKHEETRSREDIIKELKNLSPDTPTEYVHSGKVYARDNKTVAQLKIVRQHKCQICGIMIKKKDGSFYTEAAHIQSKREHGPETPSNLMILCPNHHKEFDLGDTKIIEHKTDYIAFKMNQREYAVQLTLC